MRPSRTPAVLAAPGFWLAVYLGAVLTPLAVLILLPTPAKWGFWWDIGIGLGFAGLVMMGIQFLLTARFRTATAPFGMDLIYYFHRYLAYALLVVVLAHPVILIAVDPPLAGRLNPFTAPFPVTAGGLSLFLLLAVVISSAGRKRLRIAYDAWKRAHLVLAVAAVGLAFVHLHGIGYYSGTPVARALWVGIGLSLLGAVAVNRVVRPWQMLRRPYRVTEVTPLPANTWRLALEPVGHPGFDFRPGQFAWLVLRDSPFAMREHPFSIASAPRADGRVEFAIKERGDFTRMVGQVRPGETAYLDGPYGVFSIDRYPAAAGYVFVSGGIGIVPMVGMLRALAERGDRRPHLLIAAHSGWDRIPFRDELEQMKHRLALTVVFVVEHPPDGWTGESGWVDTALLDRHLPADQGGREYFVCGPLPLIRIVERGLRTGGVPARRMHTELFDMV